MCHHVSTGLYETRSTGRNETEAGVVIILRDIFLKPGCDSMFGWDKTTRSGLRHMDARGSLIILCPLKPIFFKLYRPRTGRANIFEECAQTADNIR